MKYIKKLKSVNILFLLKTGVGSAIAIIIANGFGLAYSASAGIITLLTIQNTKKETIVIALKRILAFALAVITAYIMFQSLGYTAVAFGGFVLIFVALCTIFGLKDGISMNAVLTTHFLIEQRMDLPLLFNEISLLFIGMGIGIVLNLIMPKNKERFQREQLELEEEIKHTLYNMSNLLRNKEVCLRQPGNNMNSLTDVNSIFDATNNIELNFSRLDTMVEVLLNKAYVDADNTLLSDMTYMVSYLEMRKLQIEVLKDITDNINHIPVLLRQTFPIADFMDRTALSFHELNNVKSLLAELEELYEYYRNENLPASREEFEYRAILFQILKQMEYFLILKRNFIKELDKKHMKSYWEDKPVS